MDSTTRELIERFRETPDDAAAYERLKARCVAAGDLLSAADLIERWGRTRRSRLESSQAYVEAAQLLADEPGQSARFVSLLELALTLHPEHARAADLLHRHFAVRSDAEGWLGSLERRRDALVRTGAAEAALAELEETLDEASARCQRRASFVPAAPPLDAQCLTPDAGEVVEDADALVEDADALVEDADALVEDADDLVEDADALVEDADDLALDAGEIVELVDAEEVVEVAADGAVAAGERG